MPPKARVSGASRASVRRVSVVIPARNERASIGDTVAAVLAQAGAGVEVEVLVVDDGSTDGTADAARLAGARTLRMETGGGPGNPAAARNRGATASGGDPIVFLDADCTPAPGWLGALLSAHDVGEVVVGGSLELPAGLSPTARCDYYCGWYLVHPRRPAGPVPHHPPPNLSVRREAFFGTSRFTERPQFAYRRPPSGREGDVEADRAMIVHNEERVWQGELRQAGHRIWFAPQARAYHHNRPGFRNLLRRNYRWAFTAIASKSRTGAARMPWLYRHPRLLISASGPLALIHTAYILLCWLRAGSLEPLWMAPAILVSRFAYAAGLAMGGIRWLRVRGRGEPESP